MSGSTRNYLLQESRPGSGTPCVEVHALHISNPSLCGCAGPSEVGLLSLAGCGSLASVYGYTVHSNTRSYDICVYIIHVIWDIWYTMQYRLYNSISHHILCLYHIIQYYIILHCTTLYWIVLHYTRVYCCTISYCIAYTTVCIASFCQSPSFNNSNNNKSNKSTWLGDPCEVLYWSLL